MAHFAEQHTTPKKRGRSAWRHKATVEVSQDVGNDVWQLDATLKSGYSRSSDGGSKARGGDGR